MNIVQNDTLMRSNDMTRKSYLSYLILNMILRISRSVTLIVVRHRAVDRNGRIKEVMETKPRP